MSELWFILNEIIFELIMMFLFVVVVVTLLVRVLALDKSLFDVNSSLTPLYTTNMNFCDLSES